MKSDDIFSKCWNNAQNMKYLIDFGKNVFRNLKNKTLKLFS